MTEPTPLTAYYGEDGKLYYQSSHPLVDGQPVGDIRPPGLIIVEPTMVPVWGRILQTWIRTLLP